MRRFYDAAELCRSFGKESVVSPGHTDKKFHQNIHRNSYLNKVYLTKNLGNSYINFMDTYARIVRLCTRSSGDNNIPYLGAHALLSR